MRKLFLVLALAITLGSCGGDDCEAETARLTEKYQADIKRVAEETETSQASKVEFARLRTLEFENDLKALDCK